MRKGHKPSVANRDNASSAMTTPTLVKLRTSLVIAAAVAKDLVPIKPVEEAAAVTACVRGVTAPAATKARQPAAIYYVY